MARKIQDLIESERHELGEYLTRRALDIARFEQMSYLDPVLGAVEDLAGDHHNVSSWLGSGVVYVSVGGLKSFSQVGDYLRAIKRVVPELRIENRERQDLDYQCRVGVFRLSFYVNGLDATCRKVQVGTETREVPIYKVVCDGQDNVNEGE